MTAKQRYTQAQVIAALRETKGMVYLAAKKLGCGAQPEELRRAGGFTWPPAKTDYCWEGLQGPVAAAKMLHRAGYDAWNWSDKALLRAVTFLYDIGWPAVGDDQWQPWVINKAYGLNTPTTGGGKGKNVGWTQWTEQ